MIRFYALFGESGQMGGFDSVGRLSRARDRWIRLDGGWNGRWERISKMGLGSSLRWLVSDVPTISPPTMSMRLGFGWAYRGWISFAWALVMSDDDSLLLFFNIFFGYWYSDITLVILTSPFGYLDITLRLGWHLLTESDKESLAYSDQSKQSCLSCALWKIFIFISFIHILISSSFSFSSRRHSQSWISLLLLKILVLLFWKISFVSSMSMSIANNMRWCWNESRNSSL